MLEAFHNYIFERKYSSRAVTATLQNESIRLVVYYGFYKTDFSEHQRCGQDRKFRL